MESVFSLGFSFIYGHAVWKATRDQRRLPYARYRLPVLYTKLHVRGAGEGARPFGCVLWRFTPFGGGEGRGCVPATHALPACHGSGKGILHRDWEGAPCAAPAPPPTPAPVPHPPARSNPLQTLHALVQLRQGLFIIVLVQGLSSILQLVETSSCWSYVTIQVGTIASVVAFSVRAPGCGGAVLVCGLGGEEGRKGGDPSGTAARQGARR